MADSGEITTGERFDRIEDVLARIESKLDGKVPIEDHRILQRRVELLESGETPLSKVFLEQFSTMQRQIGDLILHGSENARVAVKDGSELRTRVSALETEHRSQVDVTSDREARAAKTFRVYGAVLTLISVLAVVLSTAATIIAVVATH